jgi:hypothetical protein
MSKKVVLVVPEAPAAPLRPAPSRRRATGGGLRLGTLDNSKGNADHLLGFLVEGVRGALPVSSVVSLRKPHPTLPAEPALLEELAEKADCVVTAMAD